MKPSQLLGVAVLVSPVLMPLLSSIASDSSSPSLEDLLSGTATHQAPAAGSPQEGSQPLVKRTGEDSPALTAPQQPSGSGVEPAAHLQDHRWSTVPIRPIEHGPVASRQALDEGDDQLIPRSSPPMAGSGVVRFGDTLRNIAQRYGLTVQELLRLNPGLETARLVVGTQLRVAQSAPIRSRFLIGMNPVGSGGLGWPDLPRFGNGEPVRRFGGSGLGGDWVWPTEGMFTSGYGWRWGRMHKGIDVANSVGTPIVAAQRGLVIFSGWDDGGYGYLVKILHDDGTMTLYAHNSRLLVRQGQQVDQGQMISHMGSTGRSTGPHLHFEIRPPGQGAVNPMAFLPPRA